VLPQDIIYVDSESLLKIGAHNGRQWLVIAGWECQDLSNAGSGKGLHGQFLDLFPLMDVCASLQLLQPKLSPAFIFENTSIQTHRDNRIAIDDFNTICSVIGQPVLLDAAQFGSGAHRLRNFWTNLANPTQIHTVANAIERNQKLTAMMLLDPHRVTLKVVKPDQEPFYPCNKVGLPRAAFPTLVSFSPSIAFWDIGPGVVFDTKEDQYYEPNVMER
jgi:site-specific DNA-cytosine methylase